jgi:hypothetical protein
MKYSILIFTFIITYSLSADIKNLAIEFSDTNPNRIILSIDDFDSTSIVTTIDTSGTSTLDTLLNVFYPNDIISYDDNLYISDQDTIRVYDESSFTLDASIYIDSGIVIEKIERIDNTYLWALSNNGQIYQIELTSPWTVDSVNIGTIISNNFQIDRIQNEAYLYSYGDSSYKIISFDITTTTILDTTEVGISNLIEFQKDKFGSFYYLTDNYSLYRTIENIDAEFTYINGFEKTCVDFDIDKFDTNLITILFIDTDSLGYYDYKTLEGTQTIFPDSTTLHSRFDLTLNWSDVVSAQNYNISLSEDSLFSIIVLDTSLTENYLNLDSLDRSKTYYWKSQASNIYDTTDWSSFTWFDITQLNQLSILEPINNDTLLGNWSSITWDDSVGVFEIEFSNSFFQDTIVDESILFNQKSISKKLFYFDTTYTVRIRKIDNYESSLWSQIDTFYTAAITTPTTNSPSMNSSYVSDTTIFKWDGYGSSSFRIQISNDTSFSKTLFNKYLELDTLTGVIVNNRDSLYWRVRNEYKEQFSDWSTVSEFKSIVAPPTSIFPNNNTVTTNMPVLNWENDIDSSMYLIDILDSNETLLFSGSVFDTDRAIGFYLDSGKYKWKIKSVNLKTNDSSDWSETYSFSLNPSNSNSNENDILVLNSDLQNMYLFNQNDVTTSVDDHVAQYLSKSNIILNSAEFYKNGAAWKSYKLDFSKDFEFDSYFNFGDINENGGSGIAIVFRDEELSSFIGNYPEGLGYTSYTETPPRRIAAIEFDTYNHRAYSGFSSGDEPSLDSADIDHISFHLNNNRTPHSGTIQGDFIVSNGYVNAKKNIVDIEDGEIHCVKVKWEYNQSTPIRKLSVYFDGILRNEYNLTQTQIDSFTNANSKCFWGYTSSTGDTYKNKQMVYFRIQEISIQ